MNKAIPVLLAVVAMTVLWGAITNNKPLEALKLLLQGKNPRDAGKIMTLPQEYKRENDPDIQRHKRVTGGIPKNIPGQAGGYKVEGVWVSMDGDLSYPYTTDWQRGQDKVIINGSLFTVDGNNPAKLYIPCDSNVPQPLLSKCGRDGGIAVHNGKLFAKVS